MHICLMSITITFPRSNYQSNIKHNNLVVRELVVNWCDRLECQNRFKGLNVWCLSSKEKLQTKKEKNARKRSFRKCLMLLVSISSNKTNCVVQSIRKNFSNIMKTFIQHSSINTQINRAILIRCGVQHKL